MEISVVKFGGSSLGDDEKLKIVANKINTFLDNGRKVVVVASAQGKTTDELLKQATNLCEKPNKRELDSLLSVGEQISCSKLAILLNSLGHKAVSLTGWQAGIFTDSTFGEAKIKEIYTTRINNEFEKNKVVIVAGFQGIDEEKNITTLGRNGSDISAVAIAAALNQKECYIFTDTDGVYDKDPNEFSDAKKIEYISFDEMEEMAKNGAKVLHNRCVSIAKKYDIKIRVLSTFEDGQGTIVGI